MNHQLLIKKKKGLSRHCQQVPPLQLPPNHPVVKQQHNYMYIVNTDIYIFIYQESNPEPPKSSHLFRSGEVFTDVI